MKFIFGLIVTLVALVALVNFIMLPALNNEPVEARSFDSSAPFSPEWDASYTPDAVVGNIRENPYLAPGGNASMHSDGYQSDVHQVYGPTGDKFQIKTRKAGGKMSRMCATFVFRQDGKVISMCGGVFGFYLVLLDPDTLDRLAEYKLPMRPSAFQTLISRDYSISFSDSSGGAYLFLDRDEKIVLADANQLMQRIGVRETHPGKWEFYQDQSWDMRPHVPNDCLHYNNWFPRGECDMITTVMPGFDGLYWWVTRFGRVGTLDPETGEVSSIRLDNEEIQNAFTVDVDGVYVLSDYAVYGLVADATDKPEIVWRETYDRGSKRKVGSINQGSGTTPTLLDDDYITFTDNADPRINLLVLKRGALEQGQQRQVCSVPVFKDNASATDNSMIAYGRSIIFENNAGYTNGFIQKDWTSIAGGVVRIDVREDETGCDVVWESKEKVPSVVPKLSALNGLAYLYTFELDENGVPNWALVGLDFETGETVLKVPTGVGRNYNNNWASIAIAPNGTLYVGSMGGLIQIREQ